MTFFELVTLDDAKQWLRIDGDDMDPNLQIAIASASAACFAYLKKEPWWEGTEATPPDVQMAALSLIGTLIRDPDGADLAAWERGYLPPAVTNLLYPFRDPALS